MNRQCPVCQFSFLAGDALVAMVVDPYAEDGPDVLWIHERCAPPSERTIEEE